MSTDICARGFSLTPALRATVEREAGALAGRFPDGVHDVSVRLFDVNGRKGGVDKGCLVHARVGRPAAVVVATDIDADLYQAIAAAFEKLARAARSAQRRQQTLRRSTHTGPTEWMPSPTS